jgi:quercetin dioxygenase-like cupin family protein
MADYSNIFKIWGLRKRLLLTKTAEIDLLHIKKNGFCSLHNHKYKVNKFIVLKGEIKLESEYGTVLLAKGESFEIRPPLKHRFIALEDSRVIEIAYVESGKIDPNDIIREKQGGLIIEGSPKCKKPTKIQQGISTTTCMYFPSIYDEEGNNINPDKNRVTTQYTCLECNTIFSE